MSMLRHPAKLDWTVRPIEILLFVAAPTLLLIGSIWHYTTHLHLIRHLKSTHEQLWRDLGKPSIVGALLTAGTAWSIWSWENRATLVGCGVAAIENCTTPIQSHLGRD